MAGIFNYCVIDPHQLAVVIRNRIDNVLIVDSRSFLEYNSSHIINAVNVGCAKLMKRRLQQDKLSIKDFLSHNCHWDVESSINIIVYDQSTEDPSYLPEDGFMSVFLQKLLPVYNSVNVLRGGFLSFQATYPNLCENEKNKFTPLTSLSQPCLPISDHGPTRILSFLYLGSQHDALNKEVLLNHNITYELNVSTNCPKPDFIKDAHFMRISVIDNYSEKLLPHFSQAFQFLDKVRESGGCALVHCLAGISRSATVAIAYVMKHLKMSSDEAYRYVKSKRTTISPNFNFLGQLLEYENQLKSEKIIKTTESQRLTAESTDQTFSFDYAKVPYDSSSLSSLNNLTFNTCYNGTKITGRLVDKTRDASQCSNRELSIHEEKGRLKVKGLSLKCISASSLKELNFTPCHASVDKCRTALKESSSWCVSDTQIKQTSSSASGVMQHKQKPEFLFHSNSITDHKLEPSGFVPLWPSRDNVGFSLSQVTFDAKDYNRSDSTSTSGLGSEGSDLTDSWSDYHSSYERESDSMMEDEYIVPTEDDDFQKRKTFSLEETSFYGKCGVSFFRHAKYQNASQFGDSSSRHFGVTNPDCGPNCPPQSFIDSHIEEDSVINSKSGKSDGLYRARSCPGNLLFNLAPSSPDSDHSVVPTAPTFRTRSKKSKKSDNRNRYSCSSLDYMKYSPQMSMLKSCPDVPSYGASGSEAVPHQIYRHSMIQVS